MLLNVFKFHFASGMLYSRREYNIPVFLTLHCLIALHTYLLYIVADKIGDQLEAHYPKVVKPIFSIYVYGKTALLTYLHTCLSSLQIAQDSI